MTWFMVRTRKGAVLPHALHVQEAGRSEGPGELEMEDWRKVVDMVADDITRTDLSATWRPFSRIDCGNSEGRPLSRVCPVLKNCASCNRAIGADATGKLHAQTSRASSIETLWCQEVLFKLMLLRLHYSCQSLLGTGVDF